MRTRLTVDGVLVVADAAAVLAGRFAHDPAAVAAQRAADPALDHERPLEELFEEQLGCGDLVLVNKADQVGAGDRAAVEALIRAELRPGVRLVWTSHGKLDPAVALGLGVGAETDLASRPSHHDGGEEHGHDEFESFVVAVPPMADPEPLVEAACAPRSAATTSCGSRASSRSPASPCATSSRPWASASTATTTGPGGRTRRRRGAARGDRAEGPGPHRHRGRDPGATGG